MAPTAHRRVRNVVSIFVAGVLAFGLAACTGGDDTSSETKKKEDPYKNKPLPVSFDTPKGFSKSGNSQVQNPLTDNYEAQFLDYDASETAERIFVVSYVLDVDTSDMNDQELMAQVGEFDQTIGNEQKSQPYIALANGRKGIHKYVNEPLPQGEEGEVRRYDAEYFFDGNHLIQVGCEREKDQYISAVYKGCQGVLENLEF